MNPAGICYNNFDGVDAIILNRSTVADLTGWLFIAGRSNTHHTQTKWQTVRNLGAKVFAYWNFIERPDSSVSALDDLQYMGDPMRVPLWRQPSVGARINYVGNHLTDLTSTVWQDAFLAYAETIMRSGLCDGAMLDVAGGQLWSTLAAWNTWPMAERNIWRSSVSQWLTALDTLRRRIRPSFQLIVNNDPAGVSVSSIDGRVFEHPNSSAYQLNSANQSFAADLANRCVLVIAATTDDVAYWSKVLGVTHITLQSSSQYKTPTPPAVPLVACEEYNRMRAHRDALRNMLLTTAAQRDALQQKLISIRELTS